jgi:hypothetical protein
MSNIQTAYEEVAAMRNLRIQRQAQIGRTESKEWQYIQGQCEAFAAAMTVLERHGAHT